MNFCLLLTGKRCSSITLMSKTKAEEKQFYTAALCSVPPLSWRGSGGRTQSRLVGEDSDDYLGKSKLLIKLITLALYTLREEVHGDHVVVFFATGWLLILMQNCPWRCWLWRDWITILPHCISHLHFHVVKHHPIAIKSPKAEQSDPGFPELCINISA